MSVIVHQEYQDRVIAFHTSYKLITKSTNAALLLAQLVYWSNKSCHREFYLTDIRIMQETALTENELRGAKTILKKLKLISLVLKRTEFSQNPVCHYRIDFEVFSDLINKLSDGGDSLNSRNTGSEIHETLVVKFTNDQINKTKINKTEINAHSPNDRHTSEESFEAFWKAYPGPKVGKKKAKEAWVKAKPPVEKAMGACQRLGEQKSLFSNSNVAPPYLKHPTTWINGECWNDEIDLEADRKFIAQIKKQKQKFERISDSDIDDVQHLERLFRASQEKKKTKFDHDINSKSLSLLDKFNTKRET